MKKLVLGSLAVVSLLFCLLFLSSVAYRTLADRAYLKRVRPYGIGDLAGFRSRFPETKAAYQDFRNGRTNVVLTIQPPLDTLYTPSGPPAYVFDSGGRLVAWSKDTGDDLSFWHSWPLDRLHPMTQDDLQKYIEQLGLTNVASVHQ